jgi:hypothetical protein
LIWFGIESGHPGTRVIQVDIAGAVSKTFGSPHQRAALLEHSGSTHERCLRALTAPPRSEHQPQLSSAARRRYDFTQRREPWGGVEGVGRDAGHSTRTFHYDAGADERTHGLIDLRAVISNTESDVIDWQMTAAVPVEVHDEIDGTLTIRIEGRQAVD